MYVSDLLTHLERALGMETDEQAPISARENAVLAEIGRMRAERPKRKPAASAKRLNEIKRDVAMEMLHGETARSVAAKYGISEDQARRVSGQEIQRACRSALARKAGEASLVVASLDWVQSTTEDNVLRRARSDIGTVKKALEESWAHQDKRGASDANA